MKKIAIIDYGLGNLRSVFRGIERAGATPIITHNTEEIESSDGIILPGSSLDGFHQAKIYLLRLPRVLHKPTPDAGDRLLQLTDNTSDHPDTIRKQSRIRGVMNVGLYYCGIDTQLPAPDHLPFF